MTPTAEDRRFRRAQVRPARRRARAGARTLAVVRVAVLLAAAAVVVATGVRLVLRSPQFLVQRVTVRGNERLANGDVLALVDGLKGQHLLTVDLNRYRERVLGSPWVADVRFQRVLPSTVEVLIMERSPLATARIRGRLFLVDERGGIIDEYGPQYADIDLPIIDGLTTDVGSEAPPARMALLGRVLTSLAARRDLLQRVSQIDVRDARNAIVMLKNEGTRVHLGDVEFAGRLQSYIDIAPALLARVPVIDYVDVRFEPRVFVRPSPEAGAPPGRAATVSLP